MLRFPRKKKKLKKDSEYEKEPAKTMASMRAVALVYSRGSSSREPPKRNEEMRINE